MSGGCRVKDTLAVGRVALVGRSLLSGPAVALWVVGRLPRTALCIATLAWIRDVNRRGRCPVWRGWQDVAPARAFAAAGFAALRAFGSAVGLPCLAACPLGAAPADAPLAAPDWLCLGAPSLGAASFGLGGVAVCFAGAGFLTLSPPGIFVCHILPPRLTGMCRAIKR